MRDKKRMVFLGSSVTYGSAAGGVSFADMIGERTGCEIIKEAVSGTTLCDNGKSSYVSRFSALEVCGRVDRFVCQLSTNDAAVKAPPGTVSDGYDIGGFDTKTTAGAIEYITALAKKRYGCPVYFYTSPEFNSAEYGKLVELLLEISEKWGFSVIDMWNDKSFSSISDEERRRWLADPIHPTREGYLEWWTPYFEKHLFG